MWVSERWLKGVQNGNLYNSLTSDLGTCQPGYFVGYDVNEYFRSFSDGTASIEVMEL